ncbi:hypothetical protein HYW55_05355 [Candidatus Gottesmanbacteria bacterium]|nr:hypothetical protein [Candidatus Gottesmanbacteria bacterium]
MKKQKQIVVTTLQKVQPSAELPPDTDISNHFKTQDDINSAIQKGTLVEVKTQNIKISEKSYVTSELANFISTDLDPKLKDYKDVLEISSATRFLKLQILLKEKLGYLAASISYHTKGAAIDLKLSEATKKRFDVYLKEKTRLDQATVLYQNNTPLTISNLIKNGVVDENNEGAQVFRIIEDLIKEKGVELIDETFFGIRLDKDGNITEINPVFHLQYKAS